MPKCHRKIKGYFNFGKVYSDEIEKANDGDNFLEIGCWQGKSTAYLAEAARELKKDITIHVVDTFQGEGMTVQIPPFLSIFKKNMEECGVMNMIKIYEGKSDDIARLFEDEFFDFIFIDGDHRSVKSDISNYLPKLKNGKTLAGHDYDLKHKHGRYVKRDVDELLGEENLTFYRNTWIWNKD